MELKQTNVSIWSKHTIMIPINSNNNTHWELWVIHGLNKASSSNSAVHVLVLDSMNSSSKNQKQKQKTYFELLKFFIDLSAKNEFSKEGCSTKRFDPVFVEVDCPQQPDGFNWQVSKRLLSK